MLSRQLLLRQQLMRLTCVLKNSRRSTQQLVVDPNLTGTESRLSAHKPKKPNREPFVKNLLLGKFDIEFLAYPEPQTHDRHREFFEWLTPIEDYIKEHVDAREIDRTGKIPHQVLEDLKKFGVFRACVEDAYGGLELNNSEFAKLVETVSAVPVLGTYLLKRASVIRLISNFATEEQKLTYLPKIANSELIPALCFTESPKGTVAETLESKGVLDETLTSYILTGHKTYVVDARRADIFVVLAQHTAEDPYVKNKKLEAFMVPANADGIVVSSPVQILGQQGLDICSVTFNDVRFDKENRLGAVPSEAELFISAMGDGKHNVAAQAIGILKRFLNLLADNVIKSKNFNLNRQSHDALHDSIGRAAAALYSMEAMTYMTTGMADTFENQDCTVEKSLVETYCVNTCIQMLLLGMEVTGTATVRKDENFERIIRDALALSSFDRSAIDGKLFAALLGVQHAGLTLAKIVQKHRNPLHHPYTMMKTFLKFNFDEKLHLADNLHPSLEVSALSLEQSVHNLRRCVQNLLVLYGHTLMAHKMELKRLADVLINIYAMTAVVARASRSYCIGTKNADEEIKVAMIFTYHTHEKIKLLVNDMTNGDWSNGDMMLKGIAESTFQNKSYFAAHPLDRTY